MMAGIGIVSGRWGPNIAMGGRTMTTSAKGRSPNRTTIQTCQSRTTFRHNDHQQHSKAGDKGNFSRGHPTRVHEIRSGSECNSECSVMSDLEECLEEEVAPVTASPKKLNCPSQDVKCAPDPLTGNDPSEEIIRPSFSSQISTPASSSEAEIVHIGRRSQNECAIVTVIGDRSQKAVWDSGAGRCVISYDCYNSLHPRYKTELLPSSVKIRAANGTFIPNKGECDVTFRINKERFTFPFLCSDQLSQ